MVVIVGIKLKTKWWNQLDLNEQSRSANPKFFQLNYGPKVLRPVRESNSYCWSEIPDSDH